jgi:uncharacterized protein (DUF2249 family)
VTQTLKTVTTERKQAFVEIDVRELPPPEPMINILSALARLEQNTGLWVIHNRQPFPLYEKLLQAGWAYHCTKIEDALFHIHIYR